MKLVQWFWCGLPGGGCCSVKVCRAWALEEHGLQSVLFMCGLLLCNRGRRSFGIVFLCSGHCGMPGGHGAARVLILLDISVPSGGGPVCTCSHLVGPFVLQVCLSLQPLPFGLRCMCHVVPVISPYFLVRTLRACKASSASSAFGCLSAHVSGTCCILVASGWWWRRRRCPPGGCLWCAARDPLPEQSPGC